MWSAWEINGDCISVSKLVCNSLEGLLSASGFLSLVFFQSWQAHGNCSAWLRCWVRGLLQQSLAVSNGQIVDCVLRLMDFTCLEEGRKMVFSKNGNVRCLGIKEVGKAGLRLQLNPHFQWWIWCYTPQSHTPDSWDLMEQVTAAGSWARCPVLWVCFPPSPRPGNSSVTSAPWESPLCRADPRRRGSSA